jgi:voltage-gated sodium channel
MGATMEKARTRRWESGVSWVSAVEGRRVPRRGRRQASAQGAYAGVLLQRLGHKGTVATFFDILEGEQSFRAWCLQKLAHPMFDVFMGVVIVLNSIIIGVELTVQPVDPSESSPETRLFFEVFEHVFLGIYVLELLCRLYACRTSCLRNGWVRFDVFLVIMGVLGSWVAPLIISLGGDSMRDAGPSPLFLRVFRLARVARALRLFVQFRTLWMLVSGLSSSLPNVLNVFLVLSLTLFVFSCLAVEVITKERSSNGGDFQALVDQYWSSLPVIMMTLVQFVTLDTVGEIYKPMIEDNILLVFYFLPFMLMVSVILMNLVTAVVIQTFMEHVKRDEETRLLWNKQRMLTLMPRLTNVFAGLDMDGNGQITWEELKCAPTDVQVELESLLSVDSLADLFEALDQDGNMEISSDEFFDGMTRLICGNTSVDITRILKMLRSLRQDIRSLRAVPTDNKKRHSDAGSHLSETIAQPAAQTRQSSAES